MLALLCNLSLMSRAVPLTWPTGRLTWTSPARARAVAIRLRRRRAGKSHREEMRHRAPTWPRRTRVAGRDHQRAQREFMLPVR